MNFEQYYIKEWKRVSRNYSKKKHLGFLNKADLADWFVNELKKQNCCCYYCETSIHDINELINEKILTKRKTGKGWRGPVLEIDKNDDKYSKQTCVVSCMYCNNDKSYITSMKDYKMFFGPNRNNYFKILLSRLRK